MSICTEFDLDRTVGMDPDSIAERQQQIRELSLARRRESPVSMTETGSIPSDAPLPAFEPFHEMSPSRLCRILRLYWGRADLALLLTKENRSSSGENGLGGEAEGDQIKV